VNTLADRPNFTVRRQKFCSQELVLSKIQRCFGQFYFRWGGLLHVYSEWSTCAIGQYHKLCSLAAFSLPDHWSPFFARTNIPSMKHSSHFTFCWSESWFKKALHKFSKTSFSAQTVKQLFTVYFGTIFFRQFASWSTYPQNPEYSQKALTVI